VAFGVSADKASVSAAASAAQAAVTDAGVVANVNDTAEVAQLPDVEGADSVRPGATAETDQEALPLPTTISLETVTTATAHAADTVSGVAGGSAVDGSVAGVTRLGR
jgi:hypothetical protein